MAIKIISKAGLGTEGRARLLSEARTIAKLNHPNIVTVHDAGHLPRRKLKASEVPVLHWFLLECFQRADFDFYHHC